MYWEQCGKYSDDLARLVLNHGDDFSKLAVETFLKQGVNGIEFLNQNFGNSYFVWYKIFSSSKDMIVGNIPKAFQVRVNNIELFTIENATKNMSNYISKFGLESWSVNLRSELMLESYVLALGKAMECLELKPYGKYENLIYDNWEFGIDTSNNEVFYAIYLD